MYHKEMKTRPPRKAHAEKPAGPKTRDKARTRLALLAAAAAEFNEAGFDGTNTNKIAARAGYAPQSFYRHFPDKRAVFLAVYEQWVAEEQAALALARRPGDAAAVIIALHQRDIRFRQALNRLVAEDADAAAARAGQRRLQLQSLRGRLPHLAEQSDGDILAGLLVVERIADAIATGEMTLLGVPPGQQGKLLAGWLKRLYGKTPG